MRILAVCLVVGVLVASVGGQPCREETKTDRGEFLCPDGTNKVKSNFWACGNYNETNDPVYGWLTSSTSGKCWPGTTQAFTPPWKVTFTNVDNGSYTCNVEIKTQTMGYILYQQPVTVDNTNGMDCSCARDKKGKKRMADKKFTNLNPNDGIDLDPDPQYDAKNLTLTIKGEFTRPGDAQPLFVFVANGDNTMLTGKKVIPSPTPNTPFFSVSINVNDPAFNSLKFTVLARTIRHPEHGRAEISRDFSRQRKKNANLRDTCDVQNQFPYRQFCHNLFGLRRR